MVLSKPSIRVNFSPTLDAPAVVDAMAALASERPEVTTFLALQAVKLRLILNTVISK